MKMDSEAINIFFLGKGGVGKSTSSALTAVHLADEGNDVLLVSMDPAHNQSDIFEMRLSEKPAQVTQNLIAKEVDINHWIKKYLTEVENQIRRTYSYLTALNLDKYFDVIKYSPGIEEYALLMAYKEIRKKFSEKDYIIFDMPPTALALKFLGLPRLSKMWLEKLLELRNAIIEKREIITKVKFGKKVIERDKILNKLNVQIENYKEIIKEFENNKKTILNLVANPDKLSFSESELIIKKLKLFNLFICNLIINKIQKKESITEIKKKFNQYAIQVFPLSIKPLIGLEALQNYLANYISFDGNKL
jgi:arsenite/tail-anchored protein-transporting ATPase